jgi:hypothetical protein
MQEFYNDENFISWKINVLKNLWCFFFGICDFGECSLITGNLPFFDPLRKTLQIRNAM